MRRRLRPRTSGSDSAWRSLRRATTIPCGWRSGSRCWTAFRTDAWTWVPADRLRPPNFTVSGLTRSSPGRSGGRASGRWPGLLAEEDVELDGEFVHDAGPDRAPRPVQSRIRRCGWVVPGQATRNAPPSRAWGSCSLRSGRTTTRSQSRPRPTTPTSARPNRSAAS